MSIRVGIIGCGKIAQVRHIPEYAANPNTEVYGFYDINRARAEELAQRHGGKAYASYEELLADPTIEAVSVCAANHVHAEISIAALKAGKHVLCEKPMAVTLAECEAMVAAARESGKYLMIGQNQRLAKAHVKAKELIEQGAIGKVLTFRAIFGHGGPETWSVDPGKNTWFFDKTKAANVALIVDGNEKGANAIKEMLASAGTNIFPEVLFIKGGLPFLGNLNAEEKKALDEWLDRARAYMG